MYPRVAIRPCLPNLSARRKLQVKSTRSGGWAAQLGQFPLDEAEGLRDHNTLLFAFNVFVRERERERERQDTGYTCTSGLLVRFAGFLSATGKPHISSGSGARSSWSSPNDWSYLGCKT